MQECAPVSSRRLLAPACMIRIYECVWATLLRPIWRVLNLYRFPFPGLCFPSLELRHAAMQPPPSPPRNTISLINGSPPQNAVVKKKKNNARSTAGCAHTSSRILVQTFEYRIRAVFIFIIMFCFVFIPVTLPFLRWRRIRRLKVHSRLTSPRHYASHTHTAPPRVHRSDQFDLIIQNNEIVIEIRLATESSEERAHTRTRFLAIHMGWGRQRGWWWGRGGGGGV